MSQAHRFLTALFCTACQSHSLRPELPGLPNACQARRVSEGNSEQQTEGLKQPLLNNGSCSQNKSKQRVNSWNWSEVAASHWQLHQIATCDWSHYVTLNLQMLESELCAISPHPMPLKHVDRDHFHEASPSYTKSLP